MKLLPLVIGALGAIAFGVLRVLTATGPVPGWALIARPLLMVLTLASLILSRGGVLAPGARWVNYQGNTPTRLILALIALLLIPVALFAAYRLYYGPMISLANGNDQAF